LSNILYLQEKKAKKPTWLNKFVANENPKLPKKLDNKKAINYTYLGQRQSQNLTM
jgi:hypothetical protein